MNEHRREVANIARTLTPILANEPSRGVADVSHGLLNDLAIAGANPDLQPADLAALAYKVRSIVVIGRMEKQRRGQALSLPRDEAPRL